MEPTVNGGAGWSCDKAFPRFSLPGVHTTRDYIVVGPQPNLTVNYDHLDLDKCGDMALGYARQNKIDMI